MVSVNFYNRDRPIPGVTGKRIPGSARLPSLSSAGGFKTHVPFIPQNQGGSAAFREYHFQQVRDIRGRFAGGYGFAWLGISNLTANIENFRRQQGRSWQNAAQKLAQEMEAWMKENAPWEDRTTDARRGLQAQVVKQPNGGFTIMLGHGRDIYYGIWLETRWGGKFAIILPTIYHFAPNIGNDLVSAT